MNTGENLEIVILNDSEVKINTECGWTVCRTNLAPFSSESTTEQTCSIEKYLSNFLYEHITLYGLHTNFS